MNTQSHFERLADAVRAVDDPRHRLHNFFEAGFDFIAQNLAPARVMVNTIYGPNEAFKTHVYQAYLPMFELVAAEILAPGVEQGCFRPMDTVGTANLVMTVYLGRDCFAESRQTSSPFISFFDDFPHPTGILVAGDRG